VTCREAEALISAYVDRELDVAASLQMDAHVAACAGCTAALQRTEALQAAMRSAPLTFAPPADLERRVRAAIRREMPARDTLLRRAVRWGAMPAAAAAAAALTWVLLVRVDGNGGEQRIAEELVGAHVRSLMVEHLVDVPSSDQHTVRPWFNGKIDFAPAVGDYTASGFPLVGGRVDYIDGRAVAALVYRHQQHLINVFIAPAGADRWPGGAVDAHGYHLLHWSDAGLSYWAISDVSPPALQTLAELIRHARLE